MVHVGGKFYPYSSREEIRPPSFKSNDKYPTLVDELEINNYGNFFKNSDKSPDDIISQAVTMPTLDMLELIKMKEMIVSKLLEGRTSLLEAKPHSINMSLGVNSMKQFLDLVKSSSGISIKEDGCIDELPRVKEIEPLILSTQDEKVSFETKCKSIQELVKYLEATTSRLRAKPYDEEGEEDYEGPMTQNDWATLIRLNEYIVDLLPLKIHSLFKELQKNTIKDSNLRDLDYVDYEGGKATEVKMTLMSALQSNQLRVNDNAKQQLKEHSKAFKEAFDSVNTMLKDFLGKGTDYNNVLEPLYKYACDPELPSQRVSGQEIGVKTLVNALFNYRYLPTGNMKYESNSSSPIVELSLEELCQNFERNHRQRLNGDAPVSPGSTQVSSHEISRQESNKGSELALTEEHINSYVLQKSLVQKREKLSTSEMIGNYIAKRRYHLYKINNSLNKMLQYIDSDLTAPQTQTNIKPLALPAQDTQKGTLANIKSLLDSDFAEDKSNQVHLMNSIADILECSSDFPKEDSIDFDTLNKLFDKVCWEQSALKSLVTKPIRNFEFREIFMNEQDKLNYFVAFSKAMKSLRDFTEQVQEQEIQKIKSKPSAVKQNNDYQKFRAISERLNLYEYELGRIEQKVAPFIRLLQAKYPDYKPVQALVDSRREKTKNDLKKVVREWYPYASTQEINNFADNLVSEYEMPKVLAKRNDGGIFVLMDGEQGYNLIHDSFSKMLGESYCINNLRHIDSKNPSFSGASISYYNQSDSYRMTPAITIPSNPSRELIIGSSQVKVDKWVRFPLDEEAKLEEAFADASANNNSQSTSPRYTSSQGTGYTSGREIDRNTLPSSSDPVVNLQDAAFDGLKELTRKELDQTKLQRISTLLSSLGDPEELSSLNKLLYNSVLEKLTNRLLSEDESIQSLSEWQNAKQNLLTKVEERQRFYLDNDGGYQRDSAKITQLRNRLDPAQGDR